MLGLYLLVNNLLKGKAPPIRIRIFLESHIIIISSSSIITYKWDLWNLEMVCYENLVLSHQYGIFGPETTQTVPFEISSAVDWVNQFN